LSQTEAQLADLNKALEEVRSQNKARVTSILDDIHAAREKIKSLEMTLFQAETAANTKFVDAVTKTESELKAARNELTASEGVKIKDETDEIMIQTSKKLLEDFQVLHSFSTGEIAKLNEKIKLFELIDVNQRANLANSISRISKLEGYLGGAVMVPEPEVDLTSAKNSKKVVMEEGECDEDDEGEEKADEKSVSNKAEEVIISFVNKRSDEIRKEIADSKAYTDILISEIETVSTHQGIVENIRVSVKEQESSLQLKQREYMDSSLQLHYQVSDAERIVAETTNKLTAVENDLKQMDSLLNQQRSSEISSRFENWDTKHNNSATALESAKEEALATNQKVGLIEKTISSIKLRNSELQKRSEELSKIYEKEKKLRIEVNRELNKLRNKKDSDSAVTTASGNTMLSITLGMLHCPVCKLRYKGVVLNKCFHLFCKECIEDVMQKKTKKCPTCGEKINKDDIKTVFFTH
jgi:E3 ubiquitin-protein ligase BRE1